MRAPISLLMLLISASLHADLVFDQNPLEIKPKAEDEEIEATFTFKNGGDKPIHITGLESSCSCLEASLDKADYAPGEKGVGKAKFRVSSFVGENEKFLHIFTDDPKYPDQIMTSVVDVPVVVNIQPKLLQWVIGSKVEPQEFTVTMVGADPMKIINVSSTRESFKLETKEITPGREYKIKVTPTTTESITIGALKIETDSKIPKYQRQMAFFNIVKPDQLEKQ
jgi:hypothetical protein